jgi:hypothetical protein
MPGVYNDITSRKLGPKITPLKWYDSIIDFFIGVGEWMKKDTPNWITKMILIFIILYISIKIMNGIIPNYVGYITHSYISYDKNSDSFAYNTTIYYRDNLFGERDSIGHELFHFDKEIELEYGMDQHHNYVEDFIFKDKLKKEIDVKE